MAATRYSADPADWVTGGELDGLTLLYHRPSGQTHLLAEDAASILMALAEAQGDEAALAERLGLAEVADARAIILARLKELVAIGLAREE